MELPSHLFHFICSFSMENLSFSDMLPKGFVLSFASLCDCMIGTIAAAVRVNCEKQRWHFKRCIQNSPPTAYLSVFIYAYMYVCIRIYIYICVWFVCGLSMSTMCLCLNVEWNSKLEIRCCACTRHYEERNQACKTACKTVQPAPFPQPPF